MNILTKLTKKNLILNKKRAIGTIIGIILSTALICAVSGMFTSFKKTLVENSIVGTGYYHIALDNVLEEKLKEIELNKDISDINKQYIIGDTLCNDIFSYVYSIEEKDFYNLSYKIVEGTFPTNENEVIITESLARDASIKVGDYINLDIGKSKVDEELEKSYIDVEESGTYKVTGITYRRKNSTSYLIITTNRKSDSIWAYLTLKNPKDYKNSFIELLGVNTYEDVEWGNVKDINYVINNELLRWEVFAFSDSTINMLFMLVGVIILIIIIVSVFCIRNSFAISTLEKMKMYGMLSSVGATKKQIRKSVLIEGLLLGIIGIPLGILSGIFAVFVLIKIVNILLGSFLFNNIDGLVFNISIIPIILSIILSLVTIYFSCIASARRASKVSPIENLRNSEDIKLTNKKLKVPRIINNIFKTGGVLAYKNLERSKKKYRTTVISLTVSIFVFISMFYFIDMAFKQTGMYYYDYKYDILVYLDYDYKEEDIKKLRNVSNIKSSYAMYSFRHMGKVLDNNKINYYSDNDAKENELSLDIVGLDSETFKEYIKRLNLDYDKVIDKGILINELRYWSDVKEKEVINDRYSYKTGDTVNMTYELDDNTINNLSIDLASVTYERPIGLENYYYSGGFLVVNKDYFKDLTFYPEKLMIETDNSYQVVKDLEEIDNTLSINDLTEEARNEKAMIIVISIFLYGFITVITLIGVTNIFNTLTSNMELRQKEFAMLKSVGMTKKEFNRMINLETLFYSSKSLIYGIFFGLIGSYLIYLSFNEKTERAFQIPFKGIFISIVFVFIIVYIIMKYSMNKINKQNIIETIRKDNI